MHPISTNEDEQKEQLNGMKISRSLSYYESKNFKSVLPQIIATAIAGSFNIVTGIAWGYSAILIPELTKNGTAIPVTESESAWITSCLPVVVPIGAIAGGFIMDSIGRLNLLKLSAIPSTLGWILIAVATNVPMIIAGRMLTGIASVWGVSPATVYTTEIGRTDIRGSLVTAAPILVSLGMVLAYLEGWLMTWRSVAWWCIPYSVIPVFLAMLIPESPAWLVSKNRTEEARKSLQWFNRYQPQFAQGESFTEMQLAFLQKQHQLKTEEQQRTGGETKLKMFLQPTAYKPLLILSGLFFFQQFSGIFVILFYGIHFFKAVGTSIDAYLASILLGMVRLIMSIVSAWLMKRFSRRSLCMFSAAGMAIFGTLSALFTKWIHDGTTTHSWVPVCMLVFYILTSMIGLLPIPFLTIAEMFPIAIRGVGHCAVYSIGNLLMFAALQSYFTLNHLLGGASGIQFFFAAISLGALVYSFIFLPETHRKKLSEIEDYFWNHTTYLTVICGKKEKGEGKPIANRSIGIEKGLVNRDEDQIEKMIQEKV